MTNRLKEILEDRNSDGAIVTFFVDKVKELLKKIDFAEMEIDSTMYLTCEDDFVDFIMTCIEQKNYESYDELDSTLEQLRELERTSFISEELFDEIVDFIK